ncbi:hypothetical protein QTP88_001856 [Uroleucon formosanum]
MDDEEILNTLNNYFEFSEEDDDYLDPDYRVSENINLNDNTLDGFYVLLYSDTEVENDGDNENVAEIENDESVENEVINNEIETFKGKKRVANPVLWKRNITKTMRAEGKDLVNLKNKVVQSRKTGPPCTCNKEKQDTFLGELINVKSINRRRPVTNVKPNRFFECDYKVRINGTEEILVCKNAFCSLFGVENLLQQGVKTLYLFSDNCSSQNKNNALIQYLYSVIRYKAFGLETITQRYPEPGHSFLPCDRCFGSIEQKKTKNITNLLHESSRSESIPLITKSHVLSTPELSPPASSSSPSPTHRPSLLKLNNMSC